MIKISNELKQKYKNKPLIVPDYASSKKENYSLDDFKDFEWLMYYLGEVNNHEASLQKAGIDFLKGVFGLRNLVNYCMKINGLKMNLNLLLKYMIGYNGGKKKLKNNNILLIANLYSFLTLTKQQRLIMNHIPMI